MTPPSEAEPNGQTLLNAVERLVDDTENLIAEVEAFRTEVFPHGDADDSGHLTVIASRIIASYSTKSAIAGAITAVPGMVPGPGTAVALVGGSLADMTLMLKHEVELALCLTHLYGHDIRNERERWLAYVLATVNTYEARSGRNYFVDLASIQLEALRKYTPRQLSKMVATVMGRYALFCASRGLFRAVPLVGVVVGASANKVLTNAVGWRCSDALARWRSAAASPANDVVEAKVT